MKREKNKMIIKNTKDWCEHKYWRVENGKVNEPMLKSHDMHPNMNMNMNKT